ncbi:MAG: DUF1553 domain-containing protein, partial [Gemmataceae bacterium]|nr:DUF1553 domain-containing protein [Gemmataceae bacterium]
TFDFPSPDASSAERSETLVPQQALFLLNSPFAQHAARSMAARTAHLKGDERTRALFRIACGREASKEEAELARGEDAARLAQALLLSNEFTFVD